MKKVTLTIVVDSNKEALIIAREMEKFSLAQEGIYTLSCGDVQDLSLEEMSEVLDNVEVEGMRKLTKDEMKNIRGGVEIQNEEKKGFYYEGYFFEPVRELTKAESTMGIHLPLNSSSIHNYDFRAAEAKWDYNVFMRKAADAGFPTIEVFKDEDGLLRIPGQNELFIYKPEKLTDDFYSKEYKKAQKSS